MSLENNGPEFNTACGALPPNKKRNTPFSRTSIKAQIDQLRAGLKGHRGSKDLSSQRHGFSDISLVDGPDISDVICISPPFSQEDDDALCNSTFLDGLSLEYNESTEYRVDSALASFSSDFELGAIFASSEITPNSGSGSTTSHSAGGWDPTSATEDDSMLCSPLTAFSVDSSNASSAFTNSPVLTDDGCLPYGSTSDACLVEFYYHSQTPLNISIDEFGLSSSPRASFATPHTSKGLAHSIGLPISAHSGTDSRTVKTVSVYSDSASFRGLSYIEAETSQEDASLKQVKRQRRDSPYLGGFSFSDQQSNENTVHRFLSTHKTRRSCWECPCISKITRRQTIWSSSLGLTPTILDHTLVEHGDKELESELDDLCGSPTPSVVSTDCVLAKPVPPVVVPAYRLSFEQLLDPQFKMDSVQVARQNYSLTGDSSYSVVSANSSGSAPERPTADSGLAPHFYLLSNKRRRNCEVDVLSLDAHEYQKYVLSLPSPGPLVPVRQEDGFLRSDFLDLVISQSSPPVGLEHNPLDDTTRQSSYSRPYDRVDYDGISLPDTVANASVGEGPASRAGNVLRHTSESTSKLKHFASRLFKRHTINPAAYNLLDTTRDSKIRGYLGDLLQDQDSGSESCGWLTSEGWEVLPSSASSEA